MVRRQDGFTLIELLVTVLIIGLLVPIGLAAYNGQRNSARNAEAKTILRTAYAAARAFYVEGQTFGGITVADLRRNESTISATAAAAGDVPGPNADPSQIFVSDLGAPPDTLAICNVSRGDYAYCLVRNDSVVFYGKAKNSNITAAYFDALGGTGSW